MVLVVVITVVLGLLALGVVVGKVLKHAGAQPAEPPELRSLPAVHPPSS